MRAWVRKFYFSPAKIVLLTSQCEYRSYGRTATLCQSSLSIAFVLHKFHQFVYLSIARPNLIELMLQSYDNIIIFCLVQEITQMGSIEHSIHVFHWMKNQKNYCARNDIYNMMIRLPTQPGRPSTRFVFQDAGVEVCSLFSPSLCMHYLLWVLN